MQYSETEVHIDKEVSTCDPLKYIMDNPILIVAICMGKPIKIQRNLLRYYTESREKLQTRQPHLQDWTPLQYFLYYHTKNWLHAPWWPYFSKFEQIW